MIAVPAIKVTGWTWSVVQTEKLAVTGCVRLQPQNTEDESRGMTQTCTVRSDKKSVRSLHAWSKFTAKFHFHKQPGGMNGNAKGQLYWGFVKGFLKSTSHFLRSSLFFHDSFYSLFEVTPLHIHSCWTVFFGWKNTHLIKAVSSENGNNMHY